MGIFTLAALTVSHSSKPISGLWFGTFILKDFELDFLSPCPPT